MKKILYLSSVDWNWIKQRPQYIAEELMNDYEVTVVYQHRYTRKGYQNRRTGKNIIPIKVFPRIDRYKYLHWINVLAWKSKLGRVIKSINPDYIYITLPLQVKWLPKNLRAKIIYDCMDDHYGLCAIPYQKNEIFDNERKLANISDYIFISSNYLKDLFLKRYGKDMACKITLIRNGYNGELADVRKKEKKKESNTFTLCYFGTIAEWFDFDIVKRSLNDFSNIQYLLIGPKLRVNIPENPRIKYIGTVEHDQLQDVTRNADCFIMPFQVNDSIRAVDPVKLYEYINFGKNIICVDYPEVYRFKRFSYFYNNYDEYKNILSNLMKNNIRKYNNEDREKFLKENSWKEREKTIKNIISK